MRSSLIYTFFLMLSLPVFQLEALYYDGTPYQKIDSGHFSSQKMTPQDFYQKLSQQYRSHQLIDFSVEVDQDMVFINANWIPNPRHGGYAMYHDLTKKTFKKRHREMARAGLMLIRLDKYDHPQKGPCYAALWIKQDKRTVHFTDINEKFFQHYLNIYRDKDFEVRHIGKYKNDYQVIFEK